MYTGSPSRLITSPPSQGGTIKNLYTTCLHFTNSSIIFSSAFKINILFISSNTQTEIKERYTFNLTQLPYRHTNAVRFNVRSTTLLLGFIRKS